MQNGTGNAVQYITVQAVEHITVGKVRVEQYRKGCTVQYMYVQNTIGWYSTIHSAGGTIHKGLNSKVQYTVLAVKYSKDYGRIQCSTIRALRYSVYSRFLTNWQ